MNKYYLFDVDNHMHAKKCDKLDIIISNKNTF